MVPSTRNNRRRTTPGQAELWARATFASAGVDADSSSPLFETRSAFAFEIGVTLNE